MSRFTSGQQWEDIDRRREEAADRTRQARRSAAHQARRAQFGGMETLTSYGAALPVGDPQQSQDPGPSSRRCPGNMPELETPSNPPPDYQHRVPLTPPASVGEASDVDCNKQIRQLQQEVTHKENKIRGLECAITAERGERRHLQAERHKAVDAQRRADDELSALIRKVANLNELLDASIKKEHELESQLDAARAETTELKRRLHEERCRYESEIIWARELRDRQFTPQVEDTNCAVFEEEVARNRRRSTRTVESVTESETQCKEVLLVEREGHYSWERRADITLFD